MKFKVPLAAYDDNNITLEHLKFFRRYTENIASYSKR